MYGGIFSWPFIHIIIFRSLKQRLMKTPSKMEIFKKLGFFHSVGIKPGIFGLSLLTFVYATLSPQDQ